jgi:hypothetical protein
VLLWSGGKEKWRIRLKRETVGLWAAVLWLVKEMKKGTRVAKSSLAARWWWRRNG